MKNTTSFWTENRHFILFAALMLMFRSAVADWNDVPTGSMQPTIEIGDRIYVNKMAYDLRIPFTQISLHKFADPQRGEIIIFESEAADKRLVKRVIGEPGDKIAMFNNRLSINGEVIEYQTLTSEQYNQQLIENFGDTRHKIQVNTPNYLSNFSEVTVPPGHYLVLGDNRNNSADSRVIGFVPRNEIVGRSESVVLSLDYDNYFLPRRDRFFVALDDIS